MRNNFWCSIISSIFTIAPHIPRYNICSIKSDSFKEINQEKKQRSDTKNEAKTIQSDNFTESNRDNSNIEISITI